MTEHIKNFGDALTFADPALDLAGFLDGDERRKLAARRNTQKHRKAMPTLEMTVNSNAALTNRQLKFATEYVFGGDRIAAFKAAYEVKEGTPEKAVKYRSDRVANLPRVKEEIDRLREGMRRMVEVTGARLSQLCLDVVEMGQETRDGELILKAVDRLARLHGLFQDKITVQNQQLSFVMRLGPDQPWIGDISPDDFKTLEASTFEQLRLDHGRLSQNGDQTDVDDAQVIDIVDE